MKSGRGGGGGHMLDLNCGIKTWHKVFTLLQVKKCPVNGSKNYNVKLLSNKSTSTVAIYIFMLGPGLGPFFSHEALVRESC